jgi:Flp pilus assembly protein TadG
MRRLFREARGAALIEFAFALPVLVTLIWGIVQIGLLFEAYAGMQHALGEAARFATIFPTPTDDEIKAKVAAKFGTGNGQLDELQITDNKNGTVVVSKTLKLTYKQPMNFLFFNAPDVTLTQSKLVYLAAPTT